MGETELTIRLAAMVSVGVLFLSRIVWRDQARYDDGWLVFFGYAGVILSGLCFWNGSWVFPFFLAAVAYDQRRQRLEEL